MNNKKISKTIKLIGLIGATSGILYGINKSINKLATSKGLSENKKREIYPWRFGNINYKVTGEGKPVLLIHNLTSASSSIEWKEIVHKLSKTNTVYTIDLLGCGLSDRPDITYTGYMYAQLINDFIRNIIKRKTSVIATGTSASFVLNACSTNNEIFDELILINPDSIKNLHRMPSKRTKTAELILKMPIIGTFIYHLLTSKKVIRESFEERYFYDKETIPEILIDYYYESAHLGDYNAKNLCTSIAGRYPNSDIIRTLKEIDNSIHILAGAEIENIENQMKEYQYHNPAVEVEYINFTKELPQLEAPQEVLKYINLYLYND